MNGPIDAPFELLSLPAVDPKLARARAAAERRAIRKARATEVIRVLNLGAGVQSTALLLMDALVHHQGRRAEVEAWLGGPYPYPSLDFAVFADTQDEPAEVYRHLARLRAEATAPILESTRGCLGDDLIAGRNATGQQFYSIPAFTTAAEGEAEGMIQRRCTAEYKVIVVERVIRRVIFGLEPGRSIPAKAKVIQSFGLSYDEPARIAKVRARVDARGWAEPLFPLAEMELERADCLAFLASIGWTAPRSACVFCPFKRNSEWRHLRDNDPAGWRRALEVDAAIRTDRAACAQHLDHQLYLHRSCLPLGRAPIDEADRTPLLAHECEGMCGS